MNVTKTLRHQQYELSCSAKPINGGKFAPVLVITKQVWPTRPREIAMNREHFATEEQAIEAAQAQGLEWITNYG